MSGDICSAPKRLNYCFKGTPLACVGADVVSAADIGHRTVADKSRTSQTNKVQSDIFF